MEVIEVLIVEDDPMVCTFFTDYAETLEDSKIIGVTATAHEAIQTIQDRLPHAVILDLELHQGGGTGLDVLKAVKEMGVSPKPFFLITTVNTSKTVYEHARSLGADFILYKHQGGYSEKYALDLLRHMSETILSGNAPTTETPHQRETRIRQRVTSELYQVGISPKMQGFPYLIDAIELFIQEPQRLLSDTIARKYGKTKTSVERAMQNAIDKAWKTTNIDDLLFHYTAKIRSDKGVPTITEFVCFYADKIRAEY